MTRQHADTRPFEHGGVTARERQLEPQRSADVVGFALPRKDRIVARDGLGAPVENGNDKARVAHVQHRRDAVQELRRCHPRVRLPFERARCQPLRGSRNLGFQFARVVGVSLDDASRQLRFVDAATPRCKARRVRRERLEVTVHGVHDRLVEYGIEH